MSLPTINMGGGWGCGGSPSIAPYIRNWFVGKNGIDVGCGAFKIVPWAIGVDTARGRQGAEDVVLRTPADYAESTNLIGEGQNLRWFRDGSLDFVYSSHMIEHIPKEEAMAMIIDEWWRVLAPGGLLVLYLPNGEVWQADFHTWHPTPADFDAVFPNQEKMIWDPRKALPPHRVTDHLAFSFLFVARK